MIESVNRQRVARDIAAQTELATALAERQRAIATGRQLERPSDNPDGWAQVARLDARTIDTAGYLRNIDRARGRAALAETALDGLSALLQRARELVIQGTGGTAASADRSAIATELAGIGEQAADLLARGDTDGEPLFAERPQLVPVDRDIVVTTAPSLSELGDLPTLLADLGAAVARGSEPDRVAALSRVSERGDALTLTIATQALRSERMTATRDRHLSGNVDRAELRSAIADTDVTRAIAETQRLLVNLQAAQATFARLSQTSLFQLLR